MRIRRTPWARIALVCLTPLVTLACLGGVAWAGQRPRSATYGPVHIEGCVTSDGTLHVRERRHATFIGTYHSLFWVLELGYGYRFDDLEDGSLVVVGAGEYVDGAYVPYELVEAPGDPAAAPVGTYTITPDEDSYDQPPRVDVYFERTDEEAEFYVEYEARYYCDRWLDVGHLNWTFVSDVWDTWTYRATDILLDLYVERTEDSGVWEDENVFWWVHTHGEMGEVTLEDGELPAWAVPEGDARTLPAAHLAAKIDTLERGNDADVGLMFPQEWLGGMRQAQERGRDEVMQKEKVLSIHIEEAEKDRVREPANAFVMFLLVSAALVGWVRLRLFLGINDEIS